MMVYYMMRMRRHERNVKKHYVRQLDEETDLVVPQMQMQMQMRGFVIHLEQLGSTAFWPVWQGTATSAAGDASSIVRNVAVFGVKNIADKLLSNFASTGTVVKFAEHLGGNGEGDDGGVLMNRCRRTSEFASISSMFNVRRRKPPARMQAKTEEAKPAGMKLKPVADYAPIRGTYAYDVLQRLFREFDKESLGYISEKDLKVALKRLKLPASELDIQGFRNSLMETTKSDRIMFDQFANFAIKRENFLFDTFKELDKTQTGYIAAEEMKIALRKYKFRLGDSEMSKIICKLNARDTSFGLSEFYDDIPTIGFDTFRNVLMISTTKDMMDASNIWGRSAIDFGDVKIIFPFCSEIRWLWQQRSNSHSIQHIVTGSIAGTVSRIILTPLEQLRASLMPQTSK